MIKLFVYKCLHVFTDLRLADGAAKLPAFPIHSMPERCQERRTFVVRLTIMRGLLYAEVRRNTCA